MTLLSPFAFKVQAKSRSGDPVRPVPESEPIRREIRLMTAKRRRAGSLEVNFCSAGNRTTEQIRVVRRIVSDDIRVESVLENAGGAV
jgi:hypothetical protein